jgi:hypothetical protein
VDIGIDCGVLCEVQQPPIRPLGRGQVTMVKMKVQRMIEESASHWLAAHWARKA